MSNDKMSKDKTSNGTKRRTEKTLKGTKKWRMEKKPNGKNAEWEKRSNSKKHRIEKTTNGKNAEWDKTSNRKKADWWKKCRMEKNIEKHLEKSAHVHVDMGRFLQIYIHGFIIVSNSLYYNSKKFN
jgi:hypothetical protein